MKFASFQLAFLLPLASAKLGATHANNKYQPSPRELDEEEDGPYLLLYSNPNLGRCEGDCDRDSDCAGDLVCFERDSYDAVPGCSEGSSDDSENDYCIRKTDDISNPTSPNDPPVTFINNFSELGICCGDCDVDSDCEGDLICFQRDEYEAVPGCRGGSSDGSRTDYCVKSSFLWWDEMSSNSLEGCSEQGLCGECAACSTDDDCIGAFVCFQSEGIFPVPGCSGWEYNDPAFSGGHCVHPKYEVNSDISPFPLNECAGDCDSDNDCFGDLICFHREKDEKKPVPGCVGGENDSTRTDYCVHSPFVVDYIGRYQSYGGNELDISTLFPLSGCEGDCDNDSDCRGDLVCYQRDAHEAVPGCHGGEQDGSATDYCVWC